MKIGGALLMSALFVAAIEDSLAGDAAPRENSVIVTLGETAYLELVSEIPGTIGPAKRLTAAPATPSVKVTLVNASDGQAELRIQTSYNPSIGLNVRCQPVSEACTEMQRVHVTRSDGRVLKLGDDVKSVSLSDFYIPRVKKSAVPTAAQLGVAAGGGP